MKKIACFFVLFSIVFSVYAKDLYVNIGNYNSILEREQNGTLTKNDSKYDLIVAKLHKDLFSKLTDIAKKYDFELHLQDLKNQKKPSLSINVDSANYVVKLFPLENDETIEKEFNSSDIYAFNFNKSVDDKQNQESLEQIALNGEIVIAYYSFLQNNTYKTMEIEKAPIYIDSISPRSYLSQEIPNEPFTHVQAIASRDDFSFVVCDNNTIRFYDVAGNIVGSALKDISPKDIELGTVTISSPTNWNACCYDGKNIVIGNSKIDSTYTFNQNSNLAKINKYYYPSNRRYLYFSNDGNPYMFENILSFVVMDKSGFEKARIKDLYREQFKIKDNNIYQKIIYEDYVIVKDFYGNRKNILFFPGTTKSNNITLITDNSIIFSTSEDNVISFVCYSFSGKLKWKLRATDELQNSELLDYRNGMYYFARENGQIIRYADSESDIPVFLKTISDYTNKIKEDVLNNNSMYLLIANLYSSQNNDYLAYEAINKYLVYNPLDTKASEEKLNLEFKIRKQTVSSKVKNLLEIYNEQGKYAAKQKFFDVIIELENLIKQNPNDETILKQYNELVEIFDPNSSTTDKTVNEIQVKSIELSSLFPALKNVYANKPAGSIQLKNTSDKELTNIKVSCFLKKYMDYESESQVLEILKPGEIATIDLNTYLNENVMQVEENTQLQMKFTISWESNYKNNSMVITRPITMYKKSSMLWKDTAMLSCFITPSDPTISNFSFNVISLQSKKDELLISRNFQNALYLFNALKSLNLNYVPDPVTPLSNVIDNKFSVDTVRIPVETLSLQGGDCDDMTTLFCSVLESSGIPCAIITIPGHVLAAFEMGTKSNFFWQNFDDSYMIIENEKMWIPIETTFLNEGFLEAWKKASEELAQNDIEDFIIISNKKHLYPPVSDYNEKINININEQVKIQSEKSTNDVKNIVLSSISKFDSIKEAKTLNIIAKTYYTIGEEQKAIENLETCIKLEPDYQAATQNLYALYKKTGRTEDFSKLLKKYKVKGFEQSSVKVNNTDTNRASSANDINWFE